MNTFEVAKKCNARLESYGMVIPRFEIPDGEK